MEQTPIPNPEELPGRVWERCLETPMRKPLILPGGWEEVVVRESPLGYLSQALKNSHKFCSEEKPGKVVLDKSTEICESGMFGQWPEHWEQGWAVAVEAAEKKWRGGDEGPQCLAGEFRHDPKASPVSLPYLWTLVSLRSPPGTLWKPDT